MGAGRGVLLVSVVLPAGDFQVQDLLVLDSPPRTPEALLFRTLLRTQSGTPFASASS
jgi:hypothetical protein